MTGKTNGMTLGKISTEEPVLELRGITKSYPGVVALDGVDLKVNRNEIVGLIGENGAGKSTLMKILIGLIQPERGVYKLRGKVVTLRDPAKAAQLGVGMGSFKRVRSFQISPLWRICFSVTRSGFENLAFSLGAPCETLRPLPSLS